MSFGSKSKQKTFTTQSWLALGMWVFIAVLTFGCQRSEEFIAGSVTESFVQDFNPEYLEVLWVVDDRSPMFMARDKVVTEATKFFYALDSIPSYYRMGLVTTDMQFSKGALQPRGSQFVLTKAYAQSASERAGMFSSLLSEAINLRTGYQGRGLEAALTSLNGEFATQPNIPLVLIFISYADDESTVPTGTTDVVDYYRGKFVEAKGGKADLVRAYSVNYKALPSGIAANSVESQPYRCAQLYNNEIDISPATYEDRYFKVATALGGVNAELCSTRGFSSQLDLSGVRLKELPKRFQLKAVPNTDTLRVSVTRKDGTAAPIPSWAYVTATNEIVFDSAPTEGTTILVQYLPAGKK